MPSAAASPGLALSEIESRHGSRAPLESTASRRLLGRRTLACPRPVNAVSQVTQPTAEWSPMNGRKWPTASAQPRRSWRN